MFTLRSSSGRILPFILFIILSPITFISCKKLDPVSQEKEISGIQESKFFTAHAPKDSLVKSVLGFVKRQNTKGGFADKLIRTIGYPYWDKAIVTSGKRKNSHERVDSDSINTVFVPFVLDNAHSVNTTL